MSYSNVYSTISPSLFYQQAVNNQALILFKLNVVTESHYASNHGLLRTLVFSCVIVQNLFVVFLHNTSFRHGFSCKIQAISLVVLRHCLFLAIFVVLTDIALGQSSVLNFWLKLAQSYEALFNNFILWLLKFKLEVE